MNKFILYLLVILSAILYPLPFIFSNLYLLIFLPFTLIFLVAVNNRLTFWSGLVWGLIAYTLHEFAIFYSLAIIAESNKIFIVFLFSLAILFQAICSGIWFWLTSKLIYFWRKPFVWFDAAHHERPFALSEALGPSRMGTNANLIVSYLRNIIYKFNINNNYLKLSIWILTAWGYIYYFENFIFWPTGKIEGFIITNPLLPLTNNPQLLTLLPIIGKNLLTLFFLISCASLSIFINSNSFKSLKVRFNALLIFLSFFLISFSLTFKSQNQIDIKKFFIVPYAFYNPQNLQKTINQVQEKLKEIIKNYSEVEIVLLPESALFLCDLSENIKFLASWSEYSLNRNINILTGGIRKEDSKCFNSIFWIQNDSIKACFNKKHTIALTESLPTWLNCNALCHSYFKVRPIITECKKERPIFNISNNIKIIPFICSEVFFLNNFDINIPNNINSQDLYIASFCNDLWIIKFDYLKDLMALVNKFRAIEWQKKIIYVAYYKNGMFMPNGKEIELNN